MRDCEEQLTPLSLAMASELFALTQASRSYLRRWLPWLDDTTCKQDTEKFIRLCTQKSREVFHLFGARLYPAICHNASGQNMRRSRLCIAATERYCGYRLLAGRGFLWPGHYAAGLPKIACSCVYALRLEPGRNSLCGWQPQKPRHPGALGFYIAHYLAASGISLRSLCRSRRVFDAAKRVCGQ